MIHFRGRIINLNAQVTPRILLLTLVVTGCIMIGGVLLILRYRTILALTLVAYEGYRVIRHVYRQQRTRPQ